MAETLTFNIGKQGLTKEFIEHLIIPFNTRKIIKVQLLPSASNDRSRMETVAQEIIAGLPGKYNYRIIGFTIILMKRTSTKKVASKKQFMGKHHRTRSRK